MLRKEVFRIFQISSRGYSEKGLIKRGARDICLRQEERHRVEKIAVCGAANPFGKALALLLKLGNCVKSISLYDKRNEVEDVATDLGSVNARCKVVGYSGSRALKTSLEVSRECSFLGGECNYISAANFLQECGRGPRAGRMGRPPASRRGRMLKCQRSRRSRLRIKYSKCLSARLGLPLFPAPGFRCSSNFRNAEKMQGLRSQENIGALLPLGNSCESRYGQSSRVGSGFGHGPHRRRNLSFSDLRPSFFSSRTV